MMLQAPGDQFAAAPVTLAGRLEGQFAANGGGATHGIVRPDQQLDRRKVLLECSETPFTRASTTMYRAATVVNAAL